MGVFDGTFDGTFDRIFDGTFDGMFDDLGELCRIELDTRRDGVIVAAAHLCEALVKKERLVHQVNR